MLVILNLSNQKFGQLRLDQIYTITEMVDFSGQRSTLMELVQKLLLNNEQFWGTN